MPSRSDWVRPISPSESRQAPPVRCGSREAKSSMPLEIENRRRHRIRIASGVTALIRRGEPLMSRKVGVEILRAYNIEGSGKNKRFWPNTISPFVRLAAG